jgi:prevent-host-death family protein
MTTVNIHEAKTNFSRLLAQVAAGEEVIIAKAGKPVAKLVPVVSPKPKRPLGGLEGVFKVPDDIKTMFAAEIEEMFYGEDPARHAYPALGEDSTGKTVPHLP